MAHEINNPISGVLNLSMLMQRILGEDGMPAGRVKPSSAATSSGSREQTARAGRIVSDLLSVLAAFQPQRTAADLNKLIATPRWRWWPTSWS